MRTTYSSGAPWESIAGYSRAVKSGNIIEISGTTSVSEEKVTGKGDMYLQTKTILEKIKLVLAQAGAGMQHVTRTRMFVTDITRWEEAARAHAEFFSDIKPATSMVEIKSLIDKDMLIEIEATAVLD